MEPTTLHTEVVKVSCKDLLLKLPEITKQAQLDADTILREQIKDPVLQAVRQWLKAGKEPPSTSTIKNCKGLRAYKNIFHLLLLEKQYDLLCYNKLDENGIYDTKICVPLSLFMKCFELAHNNPLSGHRGDTCTFNYISRFFYLPGLYKWITMLVHDCLDCQKNKPQRHDLNEIPLEKLGELEITPFHTIHIDHKGPFRHISNQKKFCLVILGSFSPFIQVYPSKTADAPETVKLVEKYITRFGIPQQIVHDNGTAFLSNDFVRLTHEIGITLKPRTSYSTWTNGKVEVQKKT